MIRGLFAALAIADSLLFLYLFLTYGWFNFNIPDVSQSIAGVFLLPFLWAVTIAERAFAAAFFGAVASGIVRDITGRERPRWLAILSTPVFLLALAGAAAVWFTLVSAMLTNPPGITHDRLTLFDMMARNEGIGEIDMFGFVTYGSGSIGRFLIILLGVAYLAEKYLVQSWRVRWPIPIAPLIAVGWIGWIVFDGEQRQRQYVAAQQWRPLGPQVPWIDAVGQCAELGDGWRLPRREELARYLASRPAEIQSWQGAAWTSQSARGGEWAIAVDLAPRKSGRWNKASEPTRDESLCELRTQSGYAGDWFAAYRDEVCEWTTGSPYLYTPGLHITVLQGGATVTLQPGAAICIKPASEITFPAFERRGYQDEREFRTPAAFREAMRAQCRQSPDNTRAACFAYAPDVPPFEETDDERTMRAFCELVWNGEGCDRYASMMAQHPEGQERAARYRELACKRGYAPACRPPM
jgi:hypothetical protein